MFRRIFLPWLVYLFYRLWSSTWRLECVETEAMKAAKARGDKLVFAHWHGDELKIVSLVTPYRIATMTSTSKDGALIDFTIRKLGGATSRGSSTRGGIGALKGLIRLMGQGYRASMAVDGPKGPLHKVKPGIFELSRLAKASIVPVGAATDRAILFKKSWNQAQLPKPFAKIVVWFGIPMDPLSKEDSPKDETLARGLEVKIAEACIKASEHLR